MAEPVGWPDSENAPSVIRRIIETATVSKPAALVGEWDCHMVLFPWLARMPFCKAHAHGNLLEVSPPSAMDLAVNNLSLNTLQCFCMETGTPMVLDHAMYDMGLDLQSALEKTGRHRLVGIGFEVVNTTPSLYKGGAVTSWRQTGTEFNGDQTYTIIQDTGEVTPNTSVKLPASCQMRRCPPLSSRLAALTPNSLTWGAEEGVYIVGTFNDDSNPATLPEYRSNIIRDNNSAELDWSSCIQHLNDQESEIPVWGEVPGGDVWVTKPFLEDDYQTVSCCGNAIQAPLNLTGAYFTGLSPQTTLTVTLTAYIETFPNFNSNLLTLARPSLAENELVLREISRALSRLPVAVKAKENNVGEWFARIVEALTPVAGVALTSAGYGMAVPFVEVSSKAIQNYARQKPPKLPPRSAAQTKAMSQTRAQARTAAKEQDIKVVVETKSKPPPVPNRRGGFNRQK